MGEFRIGRRHASHSYPETGGARGASSGANNFAIGPAAEVPLTADPYVMEWSEIAVGTEPSDEVLITPSGSGRIKIEGVISIKNTTDDTNGDVTVSITIDGSGSLPNPVQERVTCVAGGYATIPILMVTDPLSLGLHSVSINIIPTVGDVLSVVTGSSSLSVSEIPAATG